MFGSRRSAHCRMMLMINDMQVSSWSPSLSAVSCPSSWVKQERSVRLRLRSFSESPPSTCRRSRKAAASFVILKQSLQRVSLQGVVSLGQRTSIVVTRPRLAVANKAYFENEIIHQGIFYTRNSR